MRKQRSTGAAADDDTADSPLDGSVVELQRAVGRPPSRGAASNAAATPGSPSPGRTRSAVVPAAAAMLGCPYSGEGMVVRRPAWAHAGVPSTTPSCCARARARPPLHGPRLCPARPPTTRWVASGAPCAFSLQRRCAAAVSIRGSYPGFAVSVGGTNLWAGPFLCARRRGGAPLNARVSDRRVSGLHA